MSTIFSHWSHLAENFATSTADFYTAVEEALKERQIPDISVSRVLHKEGGVGSAKREYLRIQRRRLAFDVCAAPFGNGFFFSSWLTRPAVGTGLGVIFATTATLLFVMFVANVLFAQNPGCGSIIGLGLFFVFGIPGGLYLLGHLIRQGDVWDEDEVLAMPFIGRLYQILFNPHTYFRLDSTIMFQKAAHAAVLEVVEATLSAQGLRALGPEERKATFQDKALR